MKKKIIFSSAILLGMLGLVGGDKVNAHEVDTCEFSFNDYVVIQNENDVGSSIIIDYDNTHIDRTHLDKKIHKEKSIVEDKVKVKDKLINKKVNHVESINGNTKEFENVNNVIKEELFFELVVDDSEIVNGYEVFGDRMNHLEYLKKKYPYVSSYELLLNDGHVGINEMINEINKENNMIIDYDGKEVDGFEVYGEYAMNLLGTLKQQYPYVSNYEILETYWIMDTLPVRNEQNQRYFEMVKTNGEEINGLEEFGLEKLYYLYDLKEEYPYVSNYDLLTNDKEQLKEINTYNKENYMIVDYDGSEIDGFEFYGEYAMSELPSLKEKYPYVSNYEILEMRLFEDDLVKWNDKKKEELS